MEQEAVVGYTTGVFDMFHIGHLRVLQRAKQNCDHLIVGLTTDALCLSRKNKSPVVPEYERLEILKSLRCVDNVILQESMDKYKAWEALRFHKMFVGDDWKGTDQWKRIEREFNAVGVEIVYFPYTQHTSSTLLRKALEDRVKLSR